jgi:hypothetical protein
MENQMNEIQFSTREYVYLAAFALAVSILFGAWSGFVAHEQRMSGIRYDNAQMAR